jgi:hypothetical protein
MSSVEPFKRCTLCGTVWADCWQFIADRNLRVDGYQSSLVAPEYCFILVTHRVTGCGTTLAVSAGALRALYEGSHGRTAQGGAETRGGPGLDQIAADETAPEGEPAWVSQIVAWLSRHEVLPPLAAPGRLRNDPLPSAAPSSLASSPRFLPLEDHHR